MERWQLPSHTFRRPDELVDETGERPQLRPGSPVDLYRVSRAFMAGRRWLIIAGLSGLLAALAVAKAMPPTYVATAVLKFEGVRDMPGAPNPGTVEMSSLAEAISTDAVLTQLKTRLGLDDKLTTLRKDLEVVADNQTAVVRISLPDDEAKGAALRANTLAKVFIAHLEARTRGRIETEIGRVRGRLSHARAELEEGRKTYDAFRKENGLSDISADLTERIQSAADLRAQRDMATATVSSLEARIVQLERDLRRTPRMHVATSASSSPDAEELARIQTELTTARSSLSESHPRVQALDRQARALRLRLHSGQSSNVSVATMGASNHYEALATALATARADLEAKREELIDLEGLAGTSAGRAAEIAGLEGEAATLLARVNVSRALVADLDTIRVRLEDALRDPLSGFSLVAPAAAPTEAQPNKTEKLAAFGVLATTMLATAFFLLYREFRGLRVCTASELAYWGYGPVIAATAWPRDLRAVDELIADMDDYAPYAYGKTLVIGASSDQTVLAHTVAARLDEDWNEEAENVEEYAPANAPWESVVATGASEPPPGFFPNVPVSTSVALVPIGHRSTALARRVVERRTVEAWDGPDEGPSLRRAARLADRVAVIVPSGVLTAVDIAAITTRIGRTDGVGFILVDLEPGLMRLKDRVGDVSEFWSRRRFV